MGASILTPRLENFVSSKGTNSACILSKRLLDNVILPDVAKESAFYRLLSKEVAFHDPPLDNSLSSNDGIRHLSRNGVHLHLLQLPF